ncbi:MAG: hypothetical protein AB1847_08955 [bacterium]
MTRCCVAGDWTIATGCWMQSGRVADDSMLGGRGLAVKARSGITDYRSLIID